MLFLVSIDVCKLALDYLSNGPNPKKYQAASGKTRETNPLLWIDIDSWFSVFLAKYNTTPDILEDAIKALVMLLINSAKSNVSAQQSLNLKRPNLF